MAKLTRVTAKVFGETASTTNTPKEIGQFGSAKAGTYNATGDIATIQSLSAWSNGWIDAVTPTQQFPPLPEMTGVHKVLSQQIAYTLQQGIPEWDSGTTYYTNGFCSKAGKIYISLADNNTNKDPESETTYWQEFTSGSVRNIGEIVQSTIPLTDAGLHLLDGSLLSYGSYQAFIDYIADLYDSGDYTAIFETEANWQTAVTTYGVCGKFVYDSVNNTVRLPKITGFTEGTITPSTVGSLTTAGLPNITGTEPAGWESGGTGEANGYSGAFYNAGGSSERGATAENRGELIGFNASLSNSIYGNSNTVQPQSIKVLYYIVVATSTKTEIEVDIDEIATDLNEKVDKDQCVNIAPIGASWAMPSNTYDDLTLGASGATYTAPANGWFSIAAMGREIRLWNNLIGNSGGAYTSDFANMISVPVKKGQTIILQYNTCSISDSWCYFRFVYANGEV